MGWCARYVTTVVTGLGIVQLIVEGTPGQTKTVEMRIDTGDNPPIKLRPNPQKEISGGSREWDDELCDDWGIQISLELLYSDSCKEGWRAQALRGFLPAECDYKTASGASPTDW